MNETGKSSGGNAANPIEIPNLDDLAIIEKIRRESIEQSESNEAQRKLELIKERLKAMEGSDVYGLVDASKMSLVPDLVLPPKFKVPTFDKLLIHYFQDSLTGSTTRWYNLLSRD